MRFQAVTVENIGGLADQRIELPMTPLVAFAGPNGTGKTKLLASMIGLWINNIPAPRQGTTASVALEIALSNEERASLKRFHTEVFRAEPPEQPELVTITTTRSQVAGTRREYDPHTAALGSFVDNREFMQQNLSLNPMYLPPERRLLPSRDSTVDFAQLGLEMAFAQTQNSRAATQNYGLMDDEEFERFAMALCMADTLPDEPGEASEVPAQPISRIGWPEFRETINELLHPKELMPMSKQFADHLRIRLPNGDIHRVPELSSGERQALIIISRVLRAGAGHSVVLIDEPDAHLHPNLSLRLMQALQRGTGESGQLIVATHSPSILDRIAPDSILRLDYEKPATPLAQKSDLVELHRATGFRASALTQSDLLVVSEGDLEDAVLETLFPKLSRASMQRGPGRDGVFYQVKHLLDYEVPVLGLVDRDVEPPVLDPPLDQHVLILETADLEGAFLCEDAVLQIMIDDAFTKEAYRDLQALKAERDQLFEALRDNTVAELAQRSLRKQGFGIKWPASRGTDPIDRLMDVASTTVNPTQTDVQAALDAAKKTWEAGKAEPWKLVRGKYILGAFTDKCTNFKTGSSLLVAVAQEQPKLNALKPFGKAVDRLLP